MKTLKLRKMGAPTNENEIGNHRVRCKFLSAEGRTVTADCGHMVLNPTAHKKNRKMNALLGPDTGFDMINTATCGGEIAQLLSALNDTDECPKTIIYSLNPGDDAQIGTILGCFQNSEVPGKIQHGSAWWFNDHKIGMEEQMTRLASLGLLGNFVGMLTDSRSFLSYTRHDYFRRILCNLIGQWVEDGEYPNDEKALEKIVRGICFDNAKRYFNL